MRNVPRFVLGLVISAILHGALVALISFMELGSRYAV